MALRYGPYHEEVHGHGDIVTIRAPIDWLRDYNIEVVDTPGGLRVNRGYSGI